MSEAIKPTPGPWVVLPEEADKDYLRVRGTRLGGRYKVADVHCLKYASLETNLRESVESAANARLIAEAGTVAHETGLTPRQLVERVKELEEALRRLLNAELDTHLTVQGVRNLARAALSKALPNTVAEVK